METTTNKNNYIFANFTDGGTETLQWFMDMPSDWNSSDANLGKVSFFSNMDRFIWFWNSRMGYRW